jgi:pimeloyl-ACP methyl ester carboxylesterase
MAEARSSDGTKITFERQGSGDPILFVHGTTASSQAWVPVASHLTDRFTVVAMDRRGHGSSEPGPRHSIDAEADDVVAVLDAIGEPVHLVGYSFGARVALKAAARSDRVRSLVVYEPPIAVQHNPPDLPDRAEAMIGAGDRDGAAQTFLREAAALPDEEIAVLRGLAPVWERITAGAHNGPRDQRALMTQPVDLDEVRRVRVPALILVGGEQDAPVYLDGLDEIEAALPDARREFIPGQRHMAPAFAPEAFAERVAAFLADVTPT